MDALPAINASLNALSFCLLLAGWRAVRSGRIDLHKRLMISALISSSAFLACYLTYHYSVGHTKFTAQGWPAWVYYAILITHIPLAVLMVPPILILFVHGLRGRIEKHRRLARITLPVWLYVSVTGVAIYFMLYHFFPPTA